MKTLPPDTPIEKIPPNETFNWNNEIMDNHELDTIQKYNPIWLECNNLDSDWHEKQRSILIDAINDCQAMNLLIVVTDIHVLEALLPILFNYEFSVNKFHFTDDSKSLTIRMK